MKWGMQILKAKNPIKVAKRIFAFSPGPKIWKFDNPFCSSQNILNICNNPSPLYLHFSALLPDMQKNTLYFRPG